MAARVLLQSGRFTRFAFATLDGFVRGAPTWAKWSRLRPQLYFVGATSIPVLALTGAFIGAILAIEG